jgi:HD-like signal output (HDOD) protein
MVDKQDANADQEFGLLVSQPGTPQQAVATFLTLILHFRYGLEVIKVDSLFKAFAAVQQDGERIRCSFVIMSQKIGTPASVSSLTLDGRFPLVCVLPASLIEEQRTVFQRQQNVLFCSWEEASGQTDNSLYRIIERTFAQHGIGDLFRDVQRLPYERLQQKVERRLRNITTLPTLPELVMRVMKVTADPRSTVAQVEEILAHDPAIVHKLLQVVNSPIFARPDRQGEWSLQEAIVRLGMRQVATIAQQIRVMNSLVRPQESQFDLQRFWAHSAGCALVAHRLVAQNRVRLRGSLDFNDYWIGALLHDIGKLVLGFFFWDRYAAILAQMAESGTSFRQAERDLGDVADHEYLGGLLLLKSRATEGLVEAVRSHHSTGENPSPLTCLIHLSDNLCKAMGLGCLEEEPIACRPAVLDALQLNQGDLVRLKEELTQGEDVPTEARELLSRCLRN